MPKSIRFPTERSAGVLGIIRTHAIDSRCDRACAAFVTRERCDFVALHGVGINAFVAQHFSDRELYMVALVAGGSVKRWLPEDIRFACRFTITPAGRAIVKEASCVEVH